MFHRINPKKAQTSHFVVIVEARRERESFLNWQAFLPFDSANTSTTTEINTKFYFINFTDLKHNHLMTVCSPSSSKCRGIFLILLFRLFLVPLLHAWNKQKDFLSSIFFSFASFCYQHPIYFVLFFPFLFSWGKVFRLEIPLRITK